ncbi:MAG: hypothetical protein WC767_04065 [Candidatus Paceibacterota bacterium]
MQQQILKVFMSIRGGREVRSVKAGSGIRFVVKHEGSEAWAEIQGKEGRSLVRGNVATQDYYLPEDYMAVLARGREGKRQAKQALVREPVHVSGDEADEAFPRLLCRGVPVRVVPRISVGLVRRVGLDQAELGCCDQAHPREGIQAAVA